jgi:hypothetical protein
VRPLFFNPRPGLVSDPLLTAVSVCSGHRNLTAFTSNGVVPRDVSGETVLEIAKLGHAALIKDR